MLRLTRIAVIGSSGFRRGWCYLHGVAWVAVGFFIIWLSLYFGWRLLDRRGPSEVLVPFGVMVAIGAAIAWLGRRLIAATRGDQRSAAIVRRALLVLLGCFVLVIAASIIRALGGAADPRSALFDRWSAVFLALGALDGLLIFGILSQPPGQLPDRNDGG
ncbi:MAG: hypothetical protein OES32_04600 [Acidobacteriota bacterium]|nr:hypothetical protein [Acidobacteriota bacterium]